MRPPVYQQWHQEPHRSCVKVYHQCYPWGVICNRICMVKFQGTNGAALGKWSTALVSLQEIPISGFYPVNYSVLID